MVYLTFIEIDWIGEMDKNVETLTIKCLGASHEHAQYNTNENRFHFSCKFIFSFFSDAPHLFYTIDSLYLIFAQHFAHHFIGKFRCVNLGKTHRNSRFTGRRGRLVSIKNYHFHCAHEGVALCVVVYHSFLMRRNWFVHFTHSRVTSISAIVRLEFGIWIMDIDVSHLSVGINPLGLYVITWFLIRFYR